MESGDRGGEEMRRRFYGRKFYRHKNVWTETGGRDEINHFTFSLSTPHVNAAAPPVPPPAYRNAIFPPFLITDCLP